MILHTKKLVRKPLKTFEIGLKREFHRFSLQGSLLESLKREHMRMSHILSKALPETVGLNQPSPPQRQAQHGIACVSGHKVFSRVTVPRARHLSLPRANSESALKGEIAGPAKMASLHPQHCLRVEGLCSSNQASKAA